MQTERKRGIVLTLESENRVRRFAEPDKETQGKLAYKISDVKKYVITDHDFETVRKMEKANVTHILLSK
jgi:hypothetical protein